MNPSCGKGFKPVKERFWGAMQPVNQSRPKEAGINARQGDEPVNRLFSPYSSWGGLNPVLEELESRFS